METQDYIEQLFNAMSQIKKLIENQNQESHEEKMATFMQFSALKFLKENNNSTVGDIAEHLSISKSSATQLVERLVKSDFLERVADKEDRRLVHLIISVKGEEEILEMRKKYLGKMSKVFSKMPVGDLQELVRIQTNLITELQKEQKN